jgi:hypothetical protein
VDTKTDRARVVELLLRDVEATLGPGHEATVQEFATNLDEYTDDVRLYRDRLVEDVQQYFHDCFIDVTWPRCPRHPNHPLWLHEDSWCCERDDAAIAELGGLG